MRSLNGKISAGKVVNLVNFSRFKNTTMFNLLQEAFLYAQSHSDELFTALQEHLLLVIIALGISLGVSLPLGIWTSRSRAASVTVINFFNGLRVVPSIAILFLAIPYFGLTFTSALIALTILAFPPSSSIQTPLTAPLIRPLKNRRLAWV